MSSKTFAHAVYDLFFTPKTYVVAIIIMHIILHTYLFTIVLAGVLCGQCSEGYGVTLDLLTCTSAEDQCAVGLALFLALYVVVIIIALLVFRFNTELPNELKGFVFYAQVSSYSFVAIFVVTYMYNLCVFVTGICIIFAHYKNTNVNYIPYTIILCFAGDWIDIQTFCYS